jgi:hypothetical protein
MSENNKQCKIGLSGKKGSGKSTLSDHLCKTYDFTELSFAEPLKKLVLDIFQIDPKYVYDPDYKEVIIEELGVSGRELLQVIGTELFRVSLNTHLPQLKLIGGSVWIHSLVKRMEKVKSNIVVSDCRFDDEYTELKNQGFKVFKIVRDSKDSDNSGSKLTTTQQHKSELGCKSDSIIYNLGTKQELYDHFSS